MITLPFLDVQLNALDGLLAGLGYRLIALSNSHDDAFLKLIRNRAITLQFLSDDGVARYYEFNHGSIRQARGQAAHADLTITFTDSLAGAKLLAKADVAALMSAIQDGQMRVTGDYKLVLWFASIAKQAVALPENYQHYLEQAKPYAQQVSAFAQKTLLSIRQKMR